MIARFLDPENWLSPHGGPLYLQLRRRIESGIEAGTLAENAPLPSEREIAAITGMSRVTVRKAVETLADDGLIIQKQGSGSFVAPQRRRVEQSLSRLTSFTEDMARRGMATQSHWLERGLYMPSPHEVVALGLAAGDSVARVVRLRTANDQPMAVERASLPVDILPNPTEVTGSLYEHLGRSGNRPVRAVQRISATNLAEAEAALLEVPVGAAGLSIERISYLPSGRVVEMTRSTYRGDTYDFVAELRIANEQDSR
ncbi:MAG: GntR family transcriptional regulator [Paracoccaceae bacterium]